MKQRSPVSFISLSAFLHGAAFLGLAILPALNLIPLDSAKDSIEMTEINGDNSNQPEASAEAAAPTPYTPTPPVSAPIAVKPEPIIETPKPVVVQPKPIIVRKPIAKAAAPAKKVINIDASESNTPETEVAAAENEANEDQDKFVPASESAPADPEDEVVDTAVQTAASEALSKQAREDLNEMQAPTINPVVEKLSDATSSETSPTAPATVATAATSSAMGSNELDGVAGPSSDDLRSYLDLKQARGNRAPYYPTTARRTGQQGEVVLNYYVTADGSVTNVRIVKSSGFATLDQEAIRAISRYRYVKGQEGWASHPVVFSLKSSAQSSGSDASNFASRSAGNSEAKE